MNKRKADILTVIESVPNWFEADGYTVAPHEETTRGEDNGIGPDLGVLGPTVTASPTSSRTLTDWAKDNPHTWLEATGPCKPHDWLEPGHTGQSPEVATKWAKGESADRSLYPAATRAEGGQSFQGPLSAAKGGDSVPTGTAETLTGERVTDETELSQHPFWALLMAAGYEDV